MLRQPIITMRDNKRFVLFFGDQNPNGVCSNWYKSSFIVDDIEFNCVEQYMMWAKAILFLDFKIANEILKETEPKVIKTYGRKVKNFIPEIWDKEKYNLVLKGVQAKFEQNYDLKEWIQKTRADYFVECSPYDDIWGVKLPITDKRVLEPDKWNGENLLGKILKDVYNNLAQ